MRALPLALAAAAATSFLELLPEPSMVCDNSKCRLEGEEPCLREYAIDRRCSTFGDAYLVLPTRRRASNAGFLQVRAGVDQRRERELT